MVQIEDRVVGRRQLLLISARADVDTTMHAATVLKANVLAVIAA
jgi:hypothetical protein